MRYTQVLEKDEFQIAVFFEALVVVYILLEGHPGKPCRNYFESVTFVDRYPVKMKKTIGI